MPEKQNQLMPDLDSLSKSEWSNEFERLRRNRFIMGAFRYGLMGDKSKPQYNRIQCIERRLELYRKTGNLELLVDISNMAELEFIEGTHPNRHFKSVDDGLHTETL